jgi:hypothetical protein
MPDDIAGDVAAFLANGGTIRKCELWETADRVVLEGYKGARALEKEREARSKERKRERRSIRNAGVAGSGTVRELE